MHFLNFVSVFWLAACGAVATDSTATSIVGIEALVRRRLPNHADSFQFQLLPQNTTTANNETTKSNDAYRVSSAPNGTIVVEGTSLSALSRGLHRYLADVVNVDIYWFIGSRLHVAPPQLPQLNSSLHGSSIVPWRYHFNTVTFSYTSAFWTWEDWELQLDWMALRGINLPLAWVGFEKIYLETFRAIGMTDDEIIPFFSGPAFQAWNRFGNIQGSWGEMNLPMSWIDGQYELQKKIVNRMVELGMTPVLPAFTGFVPQSISRVKPTADIVNGSEWEGFPSQYTNDTFLEPTDPLFTELQQSFITKQAAAFGNVTHIYTLDQFNENNPNSGDNDYLRNVTYNTWKSLKAADTNAIWLMQGWLFYSNSGFWTNERIESYLSGVTEDKDMLILDLFSESQPQWQRTNSYYGKPWIWCELHNYGGNMGLYGQVSNITVDPILALQNESSSMVGMGLTMEGQEGNEIVYDLLLDQAWASSPIDTQMYFHDWITKRYAPETVSPDVYEAWEVMRTTVYNNTNLTSNAVPKAIFELSPSTTGLLNRTGHHPTTLNYDPNVVITTWNLLFNASLYQPALYDNPSFAYDLVDITRQLLANAFMSKYILLISAYSSNSSTATSKLNEISSQLLSILQNLDAVLMTNPNFLLSRWIDQARAWSNETTSRNANTSIADFYEYNARNQLTLWGPSGQINDYSSKSWGGLVSSYYLPRWRMFFESLENTTVESYNQTAFTTGLLRWEEDWQTQIWGTKVSEQTGIVGDLGSVLSRVRSALPDLFQTAK